MSGRIRFLPEPSWISDITLPHVLHIYICTISLYLLQTLVPSQQTPIPKFPSRHTL